MKLRVSHVEGSSAIILYYSQKTGKSSRVVLEKETEELRRAVVSALGASLPVAGLSPANALLDGVRSECRIGIDESGKGDYFGPLVIAGVCIDADVEPRLIEIGAKDSKLLQDKQIHVIAEKTRALLGGIRDTR